MMDPARWHALSDLLDEALALSPAARVPWLDRLRQRDAALADVVAQALAEADALTGPDAADLHGDTTLPGLANFGQGLAQVLQAPSGDGPAPRLGLRLGAWQLLHKIGEGGMGQVWLARRADGLYEAQAAIKLLRSDLSSAGWAQRFARERAVLARLDHPAVARLLDAGIEDGQAYLVLEYVDGRTLAEHVRSACPGVEPRVRLLLQIAEAVDHAHAQLIVHRDLKPSNVMITRAGQPKLLDFGIAGLLDDGEPVDTDLTRQTGRGLTLGYAAPEQILGRPIGTAADVFSLGVMLFELLSGELPFAPRSSPRLELEHAVLHDEPRRLSTLLTAARQRPLPADADPVSPGRPVDMARVAGDLEAIVAKALRKDVAQRYGSVRALIDDLNHWLAHRPVSARRDDGWHRSRLWLRRNALGAAALATVLLTLAGGLAGVTWQWRRAEAAARQSDQVTQYLGDLLISASPDRHGGQWPTVLQLLQSTRETLPERFRDDPDTRIRLLQVLAGTYHELNRFDLAMPMWGELVDLSTQRHGQGDPRTLQARFKQAHTHQVQGLFDKTIAELEPLRPTYAQVFGDRSETYRQLLYVLGTSYSRVGRLDDADTTLAEAGRLTDASFPPGSRQWLSHQNHLQVLRNGQGRVREALQAILRTQPYWAGATRETLRDMLVYRRNTLAIQIRLSEYTDIEPRARALVAEMDRLMGPGNDLSAGMRHELARYFTEVGQRQAALQQREQNLALAQAAQVQHPAVVVPLQVQVLLARAQAGAAPPAELERDARALLGTVKAHGTALGYSRADAWINLVRVGLLLDDAALAAEALAPLKADAGLRLDRDRLLASRVAQIDGEVARLQGDLPRSAALLRERMQVFERPGDKQLLPAWVAALDLAWTLVLMDDAGADAALQAAAARRPPGVAAGHALDHVQAYLQARRVGPAAASAADAALLSLGRSQGRAPSTLPRQGLGSLGGAFI